MAKQIGVLTDEQASALRALVSDIEAMQDGSTIFGPFTLDAIDVDQVTIDWPNLAISLARVRQAFELA